MPATVASTAARKSTTASASCPVLRPRAFASGSPKEFQTLYPPPRRKPPTISSAMPKTTGLQRALGRRHVGDPRIEGDRGPQRPRERLELALDDVVGVAAGVQHPHVQADPGVEGEGLEHVPRERRRIVGP